MHNKGFNLDVNIIDLLTEISRLTFERLYELESNQNSLLKSTLYWLLDGGRNSSDNFYLYKNK